jgi:hypothetical protein
MIPWKRGMRGGGIYFEETGRMALGKSRVEGDADGGHRLGTRLCP